jgi:thymidine kinase
MAKLYFYYSAMNAGKSTTLLQSNYNYLERGMHTLLLTPRLDNRYGEGVIASRIGLQSKAYCYEKKDDLFLYVKHQMAQSGLTYSCVLLDESQFLSKAQVKQLANVCDELSIPVLAYGIRSDYQGELFEGSQYLLGLADELVEIKTVCHCGRKATMNMRIDEKGEAVRHGKQVHIGGNESYVATCRKHFYLGIAVSDAEMAVI